MDKEQLFYFNSRDLRCKNVFGAVPSGKKIEYSFYSKVGIYVDKVYLVIQKDGEDNVWHKMTFEKNVGGYTKFDIKLSSDTGLYWYYFEVHTERGVYELRKGFRGICSENSGIPYQLTVYDRDYKTPAFAKGGLIYHIFVDRFAKGEDDGVIFNKKGAHLKKWNDPITVVDSDGVYRANDFYGGNFQGIIDKLEYLRSLNVSILYLSPIFKSASNHRYDTGDYMCLDELLGTESKFRELVVKAAKYGMSIMLDGVFNHTGADSKYFNKFGTYDSVGAYQSKDSPYYDWFYFNKYPDEYGCWWGVTVVPTVNKSNISYRKYIFGDKGVIDKWLSFGVQGIRLDVVDELDISFVDSIRQKVKSTNSDALIIGEVWEDASNKISYSLRRPYFQGKQLDGVMNYPFKDAIMGYVMNGNKDVFSEGVMNIVENYPKMSLDTCMTFIDTHDTVRAINIFSGVDASNTTKVERSVMKLSKKERAKGTSRLKLASTIQYTLPGIPSIYYGDEVGLDGFEDPINRKPFPWDNMDKDLLEHFRTLGKIRKNYKKVFSGSIEFVQDDNLLIYDRVSKSHRIRCIFNSMGESATYIVDTKVMELMTHKEVNSVTLEAGEYALLLLE